MQPSEVETLFAQTLLGDYEGEDAWTAVFALQRDDSREIFEHATAWCLSDDPLKRARAADILCQFRHSPVTNAPGMKPESDKPEWMFRDESYSLITRMLENEQDPVVLNSAISE
jgi:hypothetical protein